MDWSSGGAWLGIDRTDPHPIGHSSNPRSPTPSHNHCLFQVGDVAPDFALKDQNGKTVKLSQFKGKKEVVLFFYPKVRVLRFGGWGGED